MNIGLDIDALSESMREFVTAKFDSLKLYAVEWLALLSAELVSVLLAALLMSGAVMFFLFALLVVLADIIGLLYSCLIVGGGLLLLSFAVCFFGQRLFADVFVGRFCRILFSLDEEDEKE
ncbi:MAG: hypothetical protein IIV73_07190 [Bacteroidaceae bacterium]|nr:hypothetical protein [Bacteroidaceae bacterium]